MATRTATIVDKEFNLTKRQLDFCINYVETGNAYQSAVDAGYSEKTAGPTANQILKQQNVKNKIDSLLHAKNAPKIATGQQVMEFFTRVMNGEEKDQFGLDISAGDRIKAAQELAKRTVDIDNRVAGQADNKIEISLKWE